MKYVSTLARLVFVALMAALLTTACGGIDTAEWSEEVRLHDGKVIVVKMMATRGSNGFPDSRRGGYRGYEIQFPSPATTWVENNIAGMVPLAIDLKDGIPYVVVLIGHCNICNALGNPDPSLMIWKWSNGQWQRASYGELPKDARLNIMGDPWDVRHYEDVRNPQNQTIGEVRDLDTKYSWTRKQDEICRFNDSCNLKFNRLLSEYVEGKPGQYHPGKVCTEMCKVQHD